MHWSIPTEVEDVNEGGTFYVNACLRQGTRTESPKKVTCKVCKDLFEHPRTPGQMAAKMVQRIIDEQEEGRKSDFQVEVKCNSCENDIDVFGWYESVEVHVLIQRMIHFMGHVTHDHAWGADILISHHTTAVSAYELNVAMGKPAATDYEANWRERMGLVPA